MKSSLHLIKFCLSVFILSISLSIKISAQRIDSLHILDTRNIASMPGSYHSNLKVNFKHSSVLGLIGVESYSTVIGLRGWGDDSGGKAYELSFTAGKIFLRSGYTAGWGVWERILTDKNIKESSNGNVGIGILTPQSKLAVNGTVTAKQVKVTQTGWPDYVFNQAYTQKSKHFQTK